MVISHFSAKKQLNSCVLFHPACNQYPSDRLTKCNKEVFLKVIIGTELSAHLPGKYR